MKNFVLVPGTSCGAWIWQCLSPLLREAGHNVYPVTLTGLGATSHLISKIDRVTLGTHIKDVTNLLFYEDLSDVILVGNSYAGMVITGVAAKEPKRLSHVVYFDAYVPYEGENEMSLWPSEEQVKVKAEIAKGNRFRPLPPNFPAFLGIKDPDLAGWVQARLTPHPISTYEDPPPIGSSEPALVPKSFINCTEGPFGAPLFETFASRARNLNWPVYELKAGHAAMLTHPKESADILLRIVKRDMRLTSQL
jgi:pimeloyl-ACP methyl ester carboxylesterase